MNVGIPKETKIHEYRVALTPKAAGELAKAGNRVFVQTEAGQESGFPDSDYEIHGAKIVGSAEELYENSELVVKVKEPQKDEYSLINENHLLFCYLHLAADRELTEHLVESGATAVGFETVESADGSLPLLHPMSRVAGILSVHIATVLTHKNMGGKGKLVCGLPGVKPAKTVIIGGGTVGYNACVTAVGLGSAVSVFDVNTAKLDFYYEKFGSAVSTLPPYTDILNRECESADIVIGAVLIPGAAAPKVVTREMISRMEKGTVLVDVSIDQGGCAETSRPTTHEDPVYEVDGVTHYCVTNIPSLVSRSSTQYLSNEILPYAVKISKGELKKDPALAGGINTEKGKLIVDLGL